MLNENIRNQILQLQALYPSKRSALIPALHLVQTEFGYLSSEIQNEIAELFNVEQNEVNAIVTFYDMFFEAPHGKHLLHVCKNVSCMLQGCDKIMAKLCEKLNVAPGETTSDGEFTLIASECLGACDRAPVMLIDEKVVGPIFEGDIERIIKEAENPSLENKGAENG
jgi:NADH-quinone oxidoreductase subunit E